MKRPTLGCPRTLRALIALSALIGSFAVHAQNINVTAANASNDVIYSVVFNNTGGGTTSVLNSDGGTLHHLTSLVFRTNPATFQLDLLAADNGGNIVQYPGDFQFGGQTFGTPVPLGGTGPANPDGLSVDLAGDLFVVNSKPGSSSNPQLWVLPSDGAGGFTTPVELDSNYGSSETLVETLVVSSAITTPAGTQLNPGDLLVLTNNPFQVLLYRGANGNGPLTPCTPAPPVCLPATPPTVLVNLPVGIIPGGMAFWPGSGPPGPPINSLLITTSRGTIYQYVNLTQNENPAPFFTGLGNGQFKIKTGVQFGSAFAYIANNNGGDILELGLNNGQVAVLATVTASVQHPQGLAVTNVAYAPVAGCQPQPNGQNPFGCDLLGNEQVNKRVLSHNVPANLNLLNDGNVVENVCVVNTDPRPFVNGQCTGPLQVNAVCPGFDNTPAGNLAIPQTLCGASGPTGRGFALVQTLTQAYSKAPHPFFGSLIYNDSNVDNILPALAAGNPLCNPAKVGMAPAPLGTLAWAPLNGEGLDPEGANLVDITDGCDNSGGRGSGLSLYGIGLALSTGDLVGYTRNKYATLSGTINDEISKKVLTDPPPPSQFTYEQLQQCISTSQTIFNLGNRAYYGGAAVELLAADQQVAAVAAMTPPFSPNGSYPNPSGTLSMLLENLYYTIMTRQLYFTAGLNGPPSPAPAPQLPAPPPLISGTPATNVKAGSPYSFIPNSGDFTGTNHGTLTFSIAAPPGLLVPGGWATFSTTTGALSGGSAVKGTYPGIVITVSDGCAVASLPAFTIKVK